MAVVWGMTILVVSWWLKGNRYGTQVLLILGRASAASLLIVSGGRCREKGHERH